MMSSPLRGNAKDQATETPQRTDSLTTQTRTFAASLKELRDANRLSMQEVATRAIISKSMISKIESNKVQPSLDVAIRLAESFGTTIGEMMKTDRFDKIIKIPFDQQAVLTDSEGQWERRLLSPSFKGSEIEIVRGKLAPKGSTGRDISHHAEEYLFILSGKLNIKIAGTVHSLEEGDSFYFEGGLEHALENPTGRATQYIIVMKN